MKKVIMMLLGVAFATCVLAAYGDIYSITPLSESGKVYKAGETVKFQVRLLSRNYDTPNPLAYQLVYTGLVTEAEDKTTNPPMLGIVVSGQLRGATITEVRPGAFHGDPTVNPYTDLICEYVVQSGDIASPIKLALNGSTENNPIVPVSADAVNNSGYILLNSDKWDLRINGQTTSASLRFVSSSTANMAKGFWNQLGTAVVDYNLAQANFQVNAPSLDPIEYLTWDAEAKSLVAATNTTYEVVTADTEKFEDGKWYVVTNTIERAGITVNGEAHLILCDGASLKVTGSTAHTGIVVPEGGALTIYGQSEGTGELTATGAGGRPGIGGHRGFSTIPCGSITINGGKVTAIGGENAAGIGGVPGLDGGAVTINGGIVVAAAGEGAAAIGAGIDGTSHGTIAFAEGVNFSIKAGASEAAATATTVADYVADHSAAYVKIEQGLFPKVTVDEIIDGENWTTFDVAYTLDNLEEGVDYKVLIEVTAGGVTKSITNATDLVNGSFTNTVDTVQLFGSKVFDGEAMVVLSLEAGGAVVSSSSEKTVELLPPPGDIFSITPLSESGKVYEAGETVKFQVRLVARNYDTPNPTAYQLVYTGSGTEAEDKTANPPMLGIVILGQLRGATITEVKPAEISGDPTVNPYTDLICEYVVQSGDFALPINLALNGSTENNPIIPVSADAVNSSGYILLNNDKWGIQTADGSKSANLWFTSSSTADMANGFWYQLGTSVIDYDLAQADFQVDALGPGPVNALGGSQSKVGDEDIYIFDSSKVGTMVLREVVEAHILVVGGGGAGASPAAITYQRGGAGGGGAGGFIENKSQIFMPGTYTITVGKGGAKGEDATASEGANGEPSSIIGGSINISAAGGGGGGLGYDTSHGLGHNGGSGGGGSAYSASAQKDGGSPVAEQGNAGGKGAITRVGAGGGGAGSAGADSKREGLNDIGGAGGAGVESDITGEAKSYAAGGGGGTHANYSSYVGVGGTGGSEIGGNGGGGSRTGGQTAATSGEAGTGSGGGGGCYNLAGGAGGSGVIIIRIKKIFPLVIEAPAEGEFFGFVDPDGFALPVQLGASDDDLKNPAGFAVKVTSCGSTLYEKQDMLFQKDKPTEIEIIEGYSYDETNVMRTATITVKTPDGRVRTRTLTFGVIPKGGVIVHNLDEINAAIGKAEEEKKYPLVLVKANVIALETGDSIALPTPDTNVNVYFSSVNRDEDLFDISAIVPTFGSPYDVVTNFADSNLVYLDPQLEWSTSAKDWVVVGYTTNVLTTVEQQLAHFINTNDVAKLVYDAERKTISLIGRGESEDFPWILDASTNVTAWVENSSLVINNGLNSEAYDIDLVAMTNNFAKYGYTAPANALVKVVNGSTTNTVTSAGWVGANGAYATLEDAIAAGEAKVLPGYAVSYEANGAAGVMTNSVFAVGKDSTLKANEFSAIGWDFAGWTLGTNTTVFADNDTVKDLAPVDGSATLTAQWSLNTNGVTEVSFAALTNTIATSGLQATTLPVTIGFTSGVKIPEGETVTLPSGSCGFNGLKYVGDDEGGSNLELADGVLYGSAMRGEVTVDALQLMKLANGGTISSFQAVSEGETTVTNAVVMLLGDDGKAYFNDTDDVDEMIADILAADPRPTKVKLYEAKSYWVSYDGAGAVGTMATDMFIPTVPTNLTANAFSALGYTFAGWTTNGVDEVAYADGAAGVDFTTPGETLELTAKWNATGVSIDAFDVLTNTLVAVTNQAASLPVTITLTGEIAVPQDGVITVNASPAITFAGEGMLDVSAIVPTFGTPSVVGEGFTSTNAPAFFDTKGISKLVYEGGTISLVARGESEDFPWILDAATNVTAWVESSNLVIDNGLTAESYEIDLVALTNNVATYNYTPASPLNAVVKVGEADYKTPKCWIGESDSYATLGAALEAGETAVLPGYEVVYEANGAAGAMTNSYFAAATEATLKANEFSVIGYDFAGWTLGTNTTVFADNDTVKDMAPVDGSATLTAQWSLNTNGVTATSFTNLTNLIAKAGQQASTLPITIDFTSNVKIEGATLPTLPTGTGFDGLKYVGDDEGGSNLELKDGVLYGSAMRGEVTVDALVLMQLANGGTISSFQAITEGETTVTNAVVMLLGDDGKAYFNDTDDVDQMIADILAADPRPTTVKLYEVKGAMVTFEAMGGTLTNGLETITYLCLPDTGYVLPDEVEREGYTLKGWFDGWKPGANKITNNQVIVDYAPQSLYAQWTSTAPTPKADELHISDVTNNVPVTEIAAKAYVNKTSVKTVTTPLYLKKICNRAFMGCTALEKLTITATRDYETLEPTKVTIEQNAFSGCTSLEELLIAGEIEKIGQSAFQNCAKLKKIIFRGDEAIAYDPGAFYRCGYANGTDELKVYMSSAFQAANAQLISDFQEWNTQVKIIDKIGVEPVTGETTVSIDPAGLVAGKRVAIVVQTSVKGTPDKEDVDIELSTDLAAWTPITEGVEKTAYPDGTVMIEITVPNAPSAFFRAVVKEN